MQIIWREETGNPVEGSNETTIKVTRQDSRGKGQVSYNSDGHLCVRVVDANREVLVVFELELSDRIINFIKANLLGERHQTDQDIPF
jgi:hypothetical protein